MSERRRRIEGALALDGRAAVALTLVVSTVVGLKDLARADNALLSLKPHWPLQSTDGRLILIDPPQGVHPSPDSSVIVVYALKDANVAPLVRWRATNEIVLRADPGGFAFGSLSPPTATLDRAGRVGPFTLTATVGAPVNRSTTISGFAYESITLGCDQSFGGGYRIDAAGVPHETTTIATSDIYWQAPIDPAFAVWNRCASDFTLATPALATLATPGGAIDLSDRYDFASVDGSRWRGRVRYQFDPRSLRGTLLWRTRDGRLMKTLQLLSGSEDLIAPTIMADAHGKFSDNT